MKAQQTSGYLYADGHAVIMFEQRVKVGGVMQNIEYAVIHEKWTQASLSFKGRLAFSRYGSLAMLDLCKRATAIRACVASTEHGSERTKAMSIAVGNLSFDFANGSYLYFTTMPDLISGQFNYQPDYHESFSSDCINWGNSKVAKIVRATQTATTEHAA